MKTARRPAAEVPPAGTGRTAKGERTLQAIHRAAVDIIAEQGLAAASQEQIAKRVGISQSALRHHYPTKEALVDAIYQASFAGYRASFERLLLEPGVPPPAQLLRLIEVHLDHIVQTDDAFTFESYAHLARSPAIRADRDAWYRWLADHYVALLQQIRPALASDAARGIALQILSLMLGAWITLGRSRPDLVGKKTADVREALIAGVETLVGARLRASP